MSGADQSATPRISIVVAMYNEEAAIDAFFADVDRAAARLPFAVEYVCVNDGSRDGTLAKLLARQSADKRIRIVDLARNFGKEAAMTAGLAHAQGDAVIVIDADLQDPPELIEQFVAKWREGFEVVYGIRASRASDSFAKRVTASAFYKLFNRITSVPIPPDAGDFRLLDRKVVDALLAFPERNRFMKGLFAWVGFKQTGVPFTRRPRVQGKTSWNYWKLVNFAIDGVTGFSTVPLRVWSVLGALVSLIGFAYAIFLIVRTIAFGVDVPGYASIMVTVLFLGGVQLLCLGMLGEYLGRLYMEAKGRPIYIVSRIYEDKTP
ncbi:MAG TPA: glycosyltransferase family 2 protein [Rhizomicrobium sp.]